MKQAIYCLIIQRFQGDGDRVFLFGQDAEVVFESVEVSPLTTPLVMASR